MSKFLSALKKFLSASIWYILIASMVLSAVGLMYLIYKAGLVYGINLQHGADTTDKGLNLLSVAYYLSSTLVALVASVSIAFARTQIRHGEESRRASVYMELDKRYNEERVQNSVRFISSLRIRHPKEKIGNENLGEFAHRLLMDLKNKHDQEILRNTMAETEYRKSLYYIMLLEYLGVLVHRGYLKSRDLFDFMGGTIVHAEDVAKYHIRFIRGNDPKIYANALFLMQMARNARHQMSVRSFNKGFYKIKNENDQSGAISRLRRYWARRQSRTLREQACAMSNPGPKPKMPYWHVYTDGDGVSHQQKFELENFVLQGIDPQTAPQWNDRMEPTPSIVTFTVLPVGWVGEWHENPRPQWIAVLTGRWFVETMDGVRVEMGPGELMMGEDQGTRERDGRKGHLSGTVGDEPCTMIVTGLQVTPTVKQPGRFK